MAYDPAHQKTVLFGGRDANTGASLADAWVWQNNTWTKLSLPTKLSARYYSAMAYDADPGGVVLFGGLGSGETYLSDT